VRLPDKSSGVLRNGASVRDKYEFIDAEYAAAAADKATTAPTITQMCKWLRVSKSGFYEWRGNPGSATARRREEMKLYIRKAFDDSDGTYGYRRMHAQLARWGVECGAELTGLVRCCCRFGDVGDVVEKFGALRFGDLRGLADGVREALKGGRDPGTAVAGNGLDGRPDGSDSVRCGDLAVAHLAVDGADVAVDRDWLASPALS
jgi:hypothetical protein